jgi:predicted metalloprotease
MRWQRKGRSRNLEDRRGARPTAGRRIPVRLPLPTGRGGKLSLGSVVAIVAVMWFLGVDPTVLLTGGAGTQVGLDPGAFGGSPDGAPGEPFRATPEEEKLVDFVSFVLDDTQNIWAQILPGYRDATLVLFRGATRSACGTGQSEMGQQGNRHAQHWSVSPRIR